MSATTLRELNGLDPAPAPLAAATLVLVDYQNTYTRGVLELTGWRAALDSAAALLAAAREAGARIIHVQHDGGPGSPYDIRTDIGRIHPRMAPAEGETVVVKTAAPNSFVGTDLAGHLEAAGHKEVVVVGFMTHMCVSYTVEARSCAATGPPSSPTPVRPGPWARRSPRCRPNRSTGPRSRRSPTSTRSSSRPPQRWAEAPGEGRG